MLVFTVVKLHTEKLKFSACAFPDIWSILSDSRRKYDTIKTVHYRSIFPDILLYAIRKYVDGKFIARILKSIALHKVPEVAAVSRKSEHSAFLLR